jgi:putative transposase
LPLTQLAYSDGTKVWVYDLIDVETRICLVSQAVTALSGHRAVHALKQAIQTMKDLGLPTHNLVIQTDGGSDYTSDVFQACANSLGQWIRSKVSQIGGMDGACTRTQMGILERMHRTFKYDYAFKHEITSLQELQAVCDGFKLWYNQQRLHSALGYKTPYNMLTKEAA